MKYLLIIAFLVGGCDARIETYREKQNNKVDGIPRCTVVSKAKYFTVYRCPIGMGAYLYCAKTDAGVHSGISCAR